MDYPHLTRQRDAADRLRQQYSEQLEDIRRNSDLSDAGRYRRAADAYAKTKAALQVRAESERESLAARRVELERQLFSGPASYWNDPGSRSVSVRDAAERASKIKNPREAVELLRQASITEDDYLARAVARRCVESCDTGVRENDEAWENVFRTFLDGRDELGPVVDELAAIETLEAPQVFSPFNVRPPVGVDQAILNDALSGREPEPPARKSVGPLLDPAKNMTTREQRQDWDAAMGVSS